MEKLTEKEVKLRLQELENQLTEIQDEIEMVMFRIDHYKTNEVKKESVKQLKYLTRDAKVVNKEMKKLLKRLS